MSCNFYHSWLDAHSGLVRAEEMAIAAGVIPRLANLGALVFEVLPEHLARVGLDGVQRQVDALQRLWRLRSPRLVEASAMGHPQPCTAADFAEVAMWETALVDAIRRAPASPSPPAGLRGDPGCALLRAAARQAGGQSAKLCLRVRRQVLARRAGAHRGRDDRQSRCGIHHLRRPVKRRPRVAGATGSGPVCPENPATE
jgi:hypothetical protein